MTASKPPLRIGAQPVLPHVREGELPVQEAVLAGQLARFLDQIVGLAQMLRIERGPGEQRPLLRPIEREQCGGLRRLSRQDGQHAARDGDRVAEVAVQHVLQGLRLSVGGLLASDPWRVGSAWASPSGAASKNAHQSLGGNQREECRHRLGLFPYGVESPGALLDLRDIAVGDRLDRRHPCAAACWAWHNVAVDRHGPALLKPSSRIGDPHPEQAVAAAEVMIEERERRAGGEGVQPECDLGQLDRHRVLVHAVHDALQDHPAHEVLVVQLRLVDLPMACSARVENTLADRRRGVRPRGNS